MIRFALVIQQNADGMGTSRPRIVLRNQNSIIGFTTYDSLIVRHGNRIKPGSETEDVTAAKFIVLFLNFTLHYTSLKCLADLEFEHVQQFVDWYCKGHGTNQYPKLDTIQQCIYFISTFIEELIRNGALSRITMEDLYFEQKTLKGGRRKRFEINRKTRVQYRSYQEENAGKCMDIPYNAAFDLIALASKYNPMLALPLAIGFFAGIRVGGICNVCRRDAENGPGIRLTKQYGNVTKIEIDIQKESLYTKHGKHTGRIKRPRVQKVHPNFIEYFHEVLEFHEEYLKTITNKHDENAMFLNSQGYALSDATFRHQFDSLVKKNFIPFLQASENPDYQNLAQDIIEKGTSPHVMRHYFSAYIASCTDNPSIIAYWRGDKSTKSAERYIQNKGILEAQLREIATAAENKLYDIGKEIANEYENDIT